MPQGDRSQPEFRVGIGYDSHRFGDGNEIVLGGVRIPYQQSLVGHSDADAVAHAVTDALLGATALGDIGELFPDTDAANRNRDSMEMLGIAAKRVASAGWTVSNVDVTVVCESPKVADYRHTMRQRLASAIGVGVDAIWVKGKTNEKMGSIGRSEGIAAIAVASVSRG